MVPARHLAMDSALIPQLREVPTVAAVPDDDIGAGTDVACLVR